MTNFPLNILSVTILSNPVFSGVSTTTNGSGCIITVPTYTTNTMTSYSIGTNDVELWRGPYHQVIIDIGSDGQWTNPRVQ